MNIIIIPDSFKGTMTAIEVCDIMSRAIRDKDPAAQITAIPMADGGEGTCQAFHYAMGGELVTCRVSDAYLQPKDAYYWRDGTMAVVELAAAAGFIADSGPEAGFGPEAGSGPEAGFGPGAGSGPGVSGRRDPSVTSTYGVGELILHAIRSGCKRVILALGGSATNDAGLGIAAALGAKFTDAGGREFIPAGGTMQNISSMDLTGLRETIRGVDFEVMCDVNNPLYGPQGAAYVFAPQKGADPAMVEFLDQNLRAFADLIRRDLGMDVSEIPGSGAAGGAGAGACAFLNARLKPGAQIVLEMVSFDELLKKADLVITGEGSLDEQSLRGKVIITVADHAKAGHVPVVAVVGTTAGEFRAIYGHGVKEVVRAIDHCPDPDHYERTCREDLYKAVEEWWRNR